MRKVKVVQVANPTPTAPPVAQPAPAPTPVAAPAPPPLPPEVPSGSPLVPLYPPEPEGDDESSLPVKRWRCTFPGCSEPLYATEGELRAHMLNAHKRTYRGGGLMPEGAVVDPKRPVTLDGGFLADDRMINPSVDVYRQLRNILDSYGVGDAREGVVDSFAYDNRPGDIPRLKLLLLQSGVQPNRVNMILDRWSKYISNIGMAVDEVQQEERKGERRGNPLKANFDDMADWGPNDWMAFDQQMQRQAMAMRMYNMMTSRMMRSMGLGGEDMNNMGMPAPGGQGPQLSSREAEELKAYRERDKLKEAIDPVMRQITNLRADWEDTKAKAEQMPQKKDSMAELLDMVKMQQLLKTMGPQHEKDAEVMRVQMEERIENKKLQMEKEYRELQAKLESEKAMNHQLEMKNVETRMAAQIDSLKTLNEVASRDKGQDLETVINNALRVRDTLKQLTGDSESDEDKKMKAVMGAIQGTIETVAPSIDKIASGFLMSQQAKVQQNMPAQRGPPQQQRGPPPQAPGMQRPPAPPSNRPMAKCTNPGCGREFEVDTSSPTAQCPGCYTVYQIGGGPQQAAPQSGPPQGPPVGDMNAKRDNLLRMDRPTLEEIARQDGLDPDQYPTHEMLVDAMMGSAYGMQ